MMTMANINREELLKDIEETVLFSGRPGHISAEMRGANKVIDRIKCAKPVPEYIEREALLCFANNHKGSTIDANDIARFPTADVVEVRHGYWDDCMCSVCGAVNPTLYLDEWEMKYRCKEVPYCPNCGAKMDGKGEE